MGTETIPGCCCCGCVSSGCVVCETGTPESIDIKFPSVAVPAVDGCANCVTEFNPAGDGISLIPLESDPCVFYSDFTDAEVNCYEDGGNSGIYIEITPAGWEVYILDNSVPPNIIAEWGSNSPITDCFVGASFSEFSLSGGSDNSGCDWTNAEPHVTPV